MFTDQYLMSTPSSSDHVVNIISTSSNYIESTYLTSCLGAHPPPSHFPVKHIPGVAHFHSNPGQSI
jgi:hypothetical protein